MKKRINTATHVDANNWDENKSQVLPSKRLTLGFGLFKMARDKCLLNTERSRYTREKCKSR